MGRPFVPISALKEPLRRVGLPPRVVNKLVARSVSLNDLSYANPAELAHIADADLLGIRNFGPAALADLRAVVPYEETPMTETTTTTDPPHATTLPAPGTIKPPKIIRFVHVAAHGNAHMVWAMDWVNTRIADLDAEIVAIAHACALGGADNPPLYSTVITYQCPEWAPSIPPIPPYPNP